jgi:hypothetical protein
MPTTGFLIQKAHAHDRLFNSESATTRDVTAIARLGIRLAISYDTSEILASCHNQSPGAEMVAPAKEPRSYFSTAMPLRIAGRKLLFIFTPRLVVLAETRAGLDTWSITVELVPNGKPASFTARAGILARDRGPDPMALAGVVASDLSLALQLPEDDAAAALFIYEEGYEVCREDAAGVVAYLRHVRDDMTSVLAGSGVTLAQFAEDIARMPYTPRCTVPLP